MFSSWMKIDAPSQVVNGCWAAACPKRQNKEKRFPQGESSTCVPWTRFSPSCTLLISHVPQSSHSSQALAHFWAHRSCNALTSYVIAVGDFISSGCAASGQGEVTLDDNRASVQFYFNIPANHGKTFFLIDGMNTMMALTWDMQPMSYTATHDSRQRWILWKYP